MGDVDAQSDDTESNQDFGIGGVDPSGDNDFNDIYYQCRYERYAAFSRANLLNEVLSLCANIDRLQHEKSEVEKRLRDVQQHLYEVTAARNGNRDRSVTVEGNQSNEEDTRVRDRPLLTHRVKPTVHFVFRCNLPFLTSSKKTPRTATMPTSRSKTQDHQPPSNRLLPIRRRSTSPRSTSARRKSMRMSSRSFIPECAVRFVVV